MSEQGSFDDHRRWVEAMIAAGEPLERIDEDIRATPVGGEERDALWLVARCLSARPRRRLGRVPPVRQPREQVPAARTVSRLRPV